MPTLETLKVKRDGPRGWHIINASAFDPKVHELFEPHPLDHDGDGRKGGSEPDEGLTKAEIIADLEAMGVDYDPRSKKADLLALRDEARAIRDA